jgi:hypothetical protein
MANAEEKEDDADALSLRLAQERRQRLEQERSRHGVEKELAMMKHARSEAALRAMATSLRESTARLEQTRQEIVEMERMKHEAAQREQFLGELMREVDLSHREAAEAHYSRDAAEQRLATSMASGAASRPLRSSTRPALRRGATGRGENGIRSGNSTFRASMLQ